MPTAHDIRALKDGRQAPVFVNCMSLPVPVGPVAQTSLM